MGAQVIQALEINVAATEPEPIQRKTDASSRSNIWWIALLLAMGTLGLYAHSLRNNFIGLDDPVYVVDNPLINQGLVWNHIVRSFNTLVTGEWHPLALISHMTDVQLFGLKPAGHHFVSALWHAFNVVLLFLLLERATGYLRRSALVAAFFAVLPLNVETVAWIAERKSLISTAFLLLALFAYGWYVRKPGVARYLLVMLCFALGLMSKSMIITLPCALLLVDYWPLKRMDLPSAKTGSISDWSVTFVRLVAEKIPLLLLAVFSAWATTRGMRRYGALISMDYYPLPWRVKNVIFSYLRYIAKGLWPTHLAVFYPYQGSTLPIWKVVFAAVVLVAITATVWHFRETRYLVTGWFWYLGTLVPVIGIVQVGHQALADRYAYVPFLGLFVAVVWLGSELVERFAVSGMMLAALTSAVLLGYAVSTYAQIGYWHDTYALYFHAAEVTSENAFAEEQLGGMLVEDGRPDLAASHFEAAIRYLPQWSVSHFDYALLLQHQKRIDESVRQYQLALAYETDLSEAFAAHINLAAIFFDEKKLSAALSELNAALKIKPTNGLALMNRGLVEYSQRNLDVAVQDLSDAARNKQGPESYFWLGHALEDKGEFNKAADAYQAALRLKPDLDEARIRLDAIGMKLR